MSQDPQPKPPSTAVSFEDIAATRDKYIAGIQSMDAEIQRLTRDRQATAGAVEALNKLIEQFKPKEVTPPAQ